MNTFIIFAYMTKIMTTEQYSKEVYKGIKGHCSQQYIRRLITKNKLDKLNNVVKVTKSGKYHLIEVDI